MPNATLEEVAEYLNVEKRWINRLVKEKGMPRLARGQYDLKVCVQWYIKFLKDEIADAESGGDSLRRAELRKAISDANRAERRDQIEEGLYVQASGVDKAMGDFITALRNKLLSVPRRFAVQLVGFEKPAQVEHVLESLVHEFLHDVAILPNRIDSLKGTKHIRRSDPEGGAKAPADGKRVGRSVPVAKSGRKRRAGKVPDRTSPVPKGDDERGQ